jgi:hypothetical protein
MHHKFVYNKYSEIKRSGRPKAGQGHCKQKQQWTSEFNPPFGSVD